MANSHRPKKPISQFIPYLRRLNFDDAFKKEIYAMFHRYILRPKFSRMWGFPFVDTDGKVRYCSNQFFKWQKDNFVKCRCSKEILIQGKNWFLDKNGCEFHPGKLAFSEQEKADVYTCCNKTNPSPGCVRKNHHVSTSRVCHEDDFVKTSPKKKCYLPCLPNVFALDCEMVYTTKGMEVVKVTVLTVFCDVVYDAFVKPRHPVIDYNTEFSGIDESNLKNATMDLKQVQRDLLNLFDTETILVGHGLENDLLCLNLYHSKVIDTSILFPHSKGFPWRYSLKTLANIHLNKQIHCSTKGHDSREDARTCIELIARKIFTSKRKEILMTSSLRSGYPLPNFPPFPPPMNWNSNYYGYCPPPFQHPAFLQTPPQAACPVFLNVFMSNSYQQNKKQNNYATVK